MVAREREKQGRGRVCVFKAEVAAREKKEQSKESVIVREKTEDSKEFVMVIKVEVMAREKREQSKESVIAIRAKGVAREREY